MGAVLIASLFFSYILFKVLAITNKLLYDLAPMWTQPDMYEWRQNGHLPGRDIGMGKMTSPSLWNSFTTKLDWPAVFEFFTIWLRPFFSAVSLPTLMFWFHCLKCVIFIFMEWIFQFVSCLELIDWGHIYISVNYINSNYILDLIIS